MSSSPARVACIIPARDEQQRVTRGAGHAGLEELGPGRDGVRTGYDGLASRGLSSLRARRTRER